MKIGLINEISDDSNMISRLTKKWGFELDIKAKLVLVITSKHLELRKIDEPKLNGIFVDFTSKNLTYRRLFGGRNEAIAKAIGIKKGYLPSVMDATAGLGRDSFILASLGCNVCMLERHPVVAALLDDGLQRGYFNTKIGGWLRKRLTLLNSINHIKQYKLSNITSSFDVVYLDPMYPPNKKSAFVKKEMRILRLLVSADYQDNDTLLESARYIAKKRVVVKRPISAPPLSQSQKTCSNIKTKNHRFDIYQPLNYLK